MYIDQLEKSKNTQIYALERGAKMILSFLGPQDCRLSYLVENVSKTSSSDGKSENVLMCNHFDNSKLFDKNNNIPVFEHGEGDVIVCSVESYHFGFNENQTSYTNGLGFLCSDEEGVCSYTVPSRWFANSQEDMKVVTAPSQKEEEQEDMSSNYVWQIDPTCQQ